MGCIKQEITYGLSLLSPSLLGETLMIQVLKLTSINYLLSPYYAVNTMLCMGYSYRTHNLLRKTNLTNIVIKHPSTYVRDGKYL